MTTLVPFADNAASVSIAELTIENGTERIALYGSLDITRDKQGLARARSLVILLGQAVRHLETGPGPARHVAGAAGRKVGCQPVSLTPGQARRVGRPVPVSPLLPNCPCVCNTIRMSHTRSRPMPTRTVKHTGRLNAVVQGATASGRSLDDDVIRKGRRFLALQVGGWRPLRPAVRRRVGFLAKPPAVAGTRPGRGGGDPAVHPCGERQRRP